MRKKNAAALWILVAMAAGIAIGYMVFTSFPDKKAAAEVAGYISLVSDVFLRLIKMVIGPLVFSTLVVGIAHMGDAASVGRVFAKSITWFITASLVSLLLGLLMANLLRPGDNLGLPLPDIGASANLATSKFTLKDFVGHMVPRSFAEAMANNEILQIVVFSMFFGVALAALGERGKILIAAIDQLSHVMLKITGYVMKLAPLAVMAAMAATVAVNGLSVLLKFAVFMGDFYVSLFLLWALLVCAGLVFLGPRVFKLLVLIKEAFMLSFATASSEAAYPKILDALDRFGVKRKISSFVMPMGYSFNLDGSMMYCTFASLFIAQAYNMHLSLGTQITMLLVLMLTSKGMAGVPRASLVVIAATLHQFGLPEAGLLLILGVDTFLDMGRSATNAVGNSIASAVVAKWEGQLLPEAEAEANAARIEAEQEATIAHPTEV
ncbi:MULTISPECIES: dicarboxylate/amino acid:cation symporter [Burkholderia cepacia complex]|uniref:dicarboxylate/amino acid:cation symporter n=1 Tax=Burkholderia cepacia complex TaxID=87882 RepID=UPI000F59E6C5|nr:MULTISPECIES: dicarboxylate/amino acid:cation symporter [Burkholderia cepacia complex]MBR8154828.1 dicarboxylate/amino acid:cation symporter [Burkholderia cenocepacia]MBR8511601.1 dicarboxylate/amino acid:cation symporter [Burkholderia cenocepacia]MCA8082442.1 dicarboxylate/amino acid:cation symporter [Burkholderia cenocepacia]MDN7580290.1 dicarboxylate/amino acid:cation symporter [Burkholderia orbicola]RQV62037.1 dicarboxylate/amino acid:cation symporter [Burkholderia cenocepacia]